MDERHYALKPGTCLPLNLISSITLWPSLRNIQSLHSKRRAFGKKPTVTLHSILVVLTNLHTFTITAPMPPCSAKHSRLVFVQTRPSSPRNIFGPEHRIILARIYTLSKSVVHACNDDVIDTPSSTYVAEPNCRICWELRNGVCEPKCYSCRGESGATYIDFSHEGAGCRTRRRSERGNESLDSINERKPGVWYAVFAFSFCYMLFLGMIRNGCKDK